MSELTHRTIETNGIRMHIAEQGEGPLVLLVHGFPELWYSWRHQLPALAEAGYHAVAPDVRGYGGSDAPKPVEAYTLKEITADMAGALDALGAETAVVVGHDWGSMIAWHCALLYPQRFRAVVGMSVPYSGRMPMQPTQLFKQVFQDNFFYIMYFQEPGVAEAELEADVRDFLRKFIYGASGDRPEDTDGLAPKKAGAKLLDGMADMPGLPSWLTQGDLDYFVSEFERTGLSGGLNRYRNMDRDWEEMPELAGRKIEQPALFIAGERDPVLSFARIESMTEHVPNLKESVLLPGAGHWVQQERPAETNAALIKFLNSLD
ncbi:MAG: alpha/beta hydrolase [Dehalococcoidia bacterium]